MALQGCRFPHPHSDDDCIRLGGDHIRPGSAEALAIADDQTTGTVTGIEADVWHVGRAVVLVEIHTGVEPGRARLSHRINVPLAFARSVSIGDPIVVQITVSK